MQIFTDTCIHLFRVKFYFTNHI